MEDGHFIDDPLVVASIKPDFSGLGLSKKIENSIIIHRAGFGPPINQKTVMDYKEKLEEAKRLYETANADQRYVLESLFPELKESEDGRIRKELCKAIWTYVPTEEGQEYIVWLEKQDEQKPDWIENGTKNV